MTAVVTLSSATITSATAILSTAAAAQTTASSKESEPAPEDENGECQLLGPFSIFIQGALGLLALLSLVYKRWRERPQRPIKIWAFDVSKQVVGSMLLHLVNLLMSIMSSGQLTAVPSAKHHDTSNPCSFYLLNLAIDVGFSILHRLVILTSHAIDNRWSGYTDSVSPCSNLRRNEDTDWKAAGIYKLW